ncbi:hypothetical protein SSP24_13520 [Streptomyces spinoverrucosus]|uniref:Uncharacterized protein n=1 Tax=Streptomyces spinoverrucosus TaxID=284043 RepID=A0A4Y3V9Q4_9ACTN|nr:hypothetical protein SSP24_13520 [Streptomyces spinoverrucosus]GHB50792.1 hypothetical protein GCM10010397_21150 [Streptomyces spinoverrucosus]
MGEDEGQSKAATGQAAVEYGVRRKLGDDDFGTLREVLRGCPRTGVGSR